MKKIIILPLIIAGYFLLTGFNLDNAIIPKNEILFGGPPKDGIPAILHPKFVHPKEAVFLKPDDQVIAVKLGNETKAYPIKILNHHEVVNDTLNNTPIAVTF